MRAEPLESGRYFSFQFSVVLSWGTEVALTCVGVCSQNLTQMTWLRSPTANQEPRLAVSELRERKPLTFGGFSRAQDFESRALGAWSRELFVSVAVIIISLPISFLRNIH